MRAVFSPTMYSFYDIAFNVLSAILSPATPSFGFFPRQHEEVIEGHVQRLHAQVCIRSFLRLIQDRPRHGVVVATSMSIICSGLSYSLEGSTEKCSLCSIDVCVQTFETGQELYNSRYPGTDLLGHEDRQWLSTPLG